MGEEIVTPAGATEYGVCSPAEIHVEAGDFSAQQGGNLPQPEGTDQPQKSPFTDGEGRRKSDITQGILDQPKSVEPVDADFGNCRLPSAPSAPMIPRLGARPVAPKHRHERALCVLGPTEPWARQGAPCRKSREVPVHFTGGRRKTG